MEACGACDELNAALGMAKSLLREGGLPPPEFPLWFDRIEEVQRELVTLMGELATRVEDRERYLQAKPRQIRNEDVDRLTQWVHAIEAQGVRMTGWATPGACPVSAAFDVARTACRRAERRIVSLGAEMADVNPQVLRYINRLSDLLWLLARKVEPLSGVKG